MTGYRIASLAVMVEEIGEIEVANLLSGFSCPLNPDVENFLRHDAVVFAKQGIAATHLVFTSYKDQVVLIGYFTLASKTIAVKSSLKISTTLRRRVCKFGTYYPEIKQTLISAPLIAQLGKNFSNGYNKLITGDELLQMACNRIMKTQQIVGGRIAYLECERKQKLLDFYERNGFRQFSTRPLDQDEKRVMSGTELVQLITYFNANSRAQADSA